MYHKGYYLEQIEGTKTGLTWVFLHDSLGCTVLWRQFPAAVVAATGYGAVVYDRLGYGLSEPFTSVVRPDGYLELEADRLEGLLADLNIDQALLFGHSDGGSIALIAAAKYPNRIKGVVTEGAHIFVEDITLEGIKTAVQLYETTSLHQRLEKYHGDKTRAVFKAWTETWLRPSFRSWSMVSFLPQIICPVLVIQGTDDEYGSAAQVQGIATHVSGKVETFMVANTAHTPHKEAAEVVLARTIDFANGL